MNKSASGSETVMLLHHHRYFDPPIHATDGSLATWNADICMCWNRLFTCTTAVTLYHYHDHNHDLPPSSPHSAFDFFCSWNSVVLVFFYFLF
jgi:hypothetical protein